MFCPYNYRRLTPAALIMNSLTMRMPNSYFDFASLIMHFMVDRKSKASV